jgi:hypothetical protein
VISLFRKSISLEISTAEAEQVVISEQHAVLPIDNRTAIVMLSDNQRLQNKRELLKPTFDALQDKAGLEWRICFMQQGV